MRVSRRIKGWNLLRSIVCAAAATSCSQNAASSVPSADSPVSGRGLDAPATQMATNQPTARSGGEPGAAAGVTAAVAMSGRGAGAAPAGAAGAVASAGIGGAGAVASEGGMTGANAGMGGEGAGAGASAQSSQSGGSGAFPAVSDFLADGPFESTQINSTGPDNNYTVYSPKTLAPNGAKNPIVAWMSGGSTNPTVYPLLPHLATHGFVVVASNTTPGVGEEVNLGKELIAGIDWAVAENMRDGSMLFDKLDVTKIASMGYSMGSLATFTIASDPRLTTTVHISGGNMVADRVNNLRAPAAFICGTPNPSCSNILSAECDIAAANCDTDFMNAKTPVFYANYSGGHLGILMEPNMSPITQLVTTWLRWKLMSDSMLTHMFVGDQCDFCTDSTWKVQQKDLQ